MPSATVSLGDMRERVALQRVTIETRDAVGGLVQTWAAYATVWARVQPMSQREQFARQQLKASASWAVTIRARTDVATQHRVVWRGRTFEVTGVENADERRRFHKLACDEFMVDAIVSVAGGNGG